MPQNNDHKNNILDEYEKEILDNLHGKKKNRIRLFKIPDRFRIHLRRIVILAAILSAIYFTVFILTLPPRYSDAETKVKGGNFAKAIEQTGEFKPKFVNALNLLKQYPYYYKKVVNNIESIELKKGIRGCPYMCVLSYMEFRSFWDLLLIERKNIKKPKLIVNPKTMNVYKTNYDLVSVLIHEADHIEYMKSNRLRKLALFVKCNPITNFRISVDSTVPSIQHRVDPMEICAQKEQIKFHKETKTQSGYEIKNGILYNFGRFIIGSFKSFFSLFFSIFKAII